MNEKSPAPAVILGLLIGAGIALGGWFIGRGFYDARMGERYVTARGLVEKNVRADIAVWTISYSATNNDVTRANAEVNHDTQLAIAFARQHGFSDSEIQPIPAVVKDTSQNLSMGSPRTESSGRYAVRAGIRIRSTNVDRVQQASQLTGALIEQGIVLSLEGDSDANPAYYFRGLDAIRPAMLAEATRSARAVAQQFAIDSGSRLGQIRRANQGVFEILPRDASAGGQSSWLEPRSIDKTVRLVTTIEYYLQD
ncbi:MAG TPA: SIMPL domain-containing protein [Candidatus Binataceae bacterium]|nr:SIMPL domain-containing protein [Candidatus Binataceae bacterium]